MLLLLHFLRIDFFFNFCLLLLKKSKVPAIASWPHLHDDILWMIAKRLSHDSFFHFGCVCTSWRSLALQWRGKHPQILPLSYFLPPQHPPPLLMLQSTENGDFWHLYSIIEKKVVSRIFLPDSKGRWICGSSLKGDWLVMAETLGQKFYLLNPISGAEIHLPPAVAFYEPLGLIDRGNHPVSTSFACKVIDLSKVADGLVVAIGDLLMRLYFCKLGDEKWTRIVDSPSEITDLIYYNGKIYAVDNYGVIIECDFSGCSPVFTPLVACSRKPKVEKHYLIESVEGELLRVTRFFVDALDNDVAECKMTTTSFEVFKLEVTSTEDNFDRLPFYSTCNPLNGEEGMVESNACKFKFVKTQNLSNQIIFVGYNHSFSARTNLFPSLKGNKIYFSEDHEIQCLARHEGDIETPASDNGIFDLEDGSICWYSSDMPDPPMPPVWIKPYLC